MVTIPHVVHWDIAKIFLPITLCLIYGRCNCFSQACVPDILLIFIAMQTLDAGHIGIAAQALGIAQA